MRRKSFLLGLLAAAAGTSMFVSASGLPPAQADLRISTSMAKLRTMASQLGSPKLDGRVDVAGKDAPALYFGSTLINNHFTLVDAISQEDGKGMTATFFAENNGEYIRVSTSVPKPDGTGRATGTILNPTGEVIAAIRQGKPFYGEVTILGVPYTTGYEPLSDATGRVIGIYYVGYRK
jgi:hypothetical protein